jgi:hypothetical protein
MMTAATTPLFDQVLHDMALMLFDFNKAEFRSSKSHSRMQPIAHIALEMIEHNEEASWMEQVIVAVILGCFAGPWEPEYIQRNNKYLQSLFDPLTRPMDAQQQIAAEPKVQGLLETWGIKL